MGNFKHQSLRSSDRDREHSDKDRERDIRDKEGQEKLRNVRALANAIKLSSSDVNSSPTSTTVIDLEYLQI
jgi:hypothetical protein